MEGELPQRPGILCGVFQMKRSVRFLALAAALLLSATAQANTVDIFESGTQIGSLTDGGVSVTFLGYTAPGTQDSSPPYQADTASFNPSDLLANANNFFGTSFTTDNRTTGNGGSMSFDIATQYFSLTFGQQRTAFFENTSGGLLHLTYTTLRGEGAGLSHYDTFAASAVPGPILGAGLPSILMALGGLIAWRRRRMTAA
jgi:hypothetical protein